MPTVPEDQNPEPEPTVEERVRAAFPGAFSKKPPPSQIAPQWLADWSLDLADRMFRGEFISPGEVEAWHRAMGRKQPTVEEARALIEECFGKPVEEALLDLQQRNN